MKKIILLIYIVNTLFAKDICQIVWIQNKDLNIYEKGLKTEIYLKNVYCDNKIVKMLKKNKLYIKKEKTLKILDNKNNIIEEVTYFKIYFKYKKLK